MHRVSPIQRTTHSVRRISIAKNLSSAENRDVEFKAPWQAKAVATALGAIGTIALFISSASIDENPVSALYAFSQLDGLNAQAAELGSTLSDETRALLRQLNDSYASYRTGWVLILVAVFAAIGIAIGSAAARKGRSFQAFFWLSLLLSPLVTGIIVATLPSQDGVRPDHPTDSEKKCPRCAETIKAEALVCRFCGNEFPAIEQSDWS